MKKGLSLFEVMVGLGILGLVVTLSAGVFRQYQKASDKIKNKIELASVVSNLMGSVIDARFVSELFFQDLGNANTHFYNCLVNGGCPSDWTELAYDKERNFTFTKVGAKITYHQVSNDLIEIQIEAIGQKTSRFYLARKFFLAYAIENEENFIKEILSKPCNEESVNVGIDYSTTKLLCEKRKPGESFQLRAFMKSLKTKRILTGLTHKGKIEIEPCPPITPMTPIDLGPLIEEF